MGKMDELRRALEGLNEAVSLTDEMLGLQEEMIRMLTDLVDKMEARIWNLELYLDYVRQVAPELWGAMTDEFIGLPARGEGGEYEPKYVRG